MYRHTENIAFKNLSRTKKLKKQLGLDGTPSIVARELINLNPTEQYILEHNIKDKHIYRVAKKTRLTPSYINAILYQISLQRELEGLL